MKANKRKLFVSWFMLFIFIMSTISPAALASDEIMDPPANPDVVTQPQETPDTQGDPDTPSAEQPGDDTPDTPSAGEGEDGTGSGAQQGEEDIDETEPPAAPAMMPISLVMPMSTPADVTTLLGTIEGTVKIGATEFKPGVSNAIVLPDGQDMVLEFEFPEVPNQSSVDEGQPYVNRYDTARIIIGTGLKSVPSDDILLKAKLDEETGLVKVGTVRLSLNGDGKVIADIIFDWDSAVQTAIESDGGLEIEKAGFKATLKYDESKADELNDKKVITVLDKQYFVTKPDVPVVYGITKKGAVLWSEKAVEWEVTVSATQGDTSILGGLTFSDNLTNVGEYVADSFYVGTTQVSPSYADKILTYEFPAGTTSPQTIKFKTAIPEEKYKGVGKQTFPNTAELKKGTTLLKSASATPEFTPTWITKTGAINKPQNGTTYDPTGRKITWTITANQDGATLDGVTINDPMPAGLTVESATWYKGTVGGATWTDEQSISPSPDQAGVYTIGRITTPIKLVIVSTVDDQGPTYSSKDYGNTAIIKWTDGPKDGISATAKVGVGYASLTKGGTRVTGVGADRKIAWNVALDPKSQTFAANLKVYDLLVHGATSITGIEGLTGWPSGISWAGLTQRVNQRYVSGSFSSEDINVNDVVVHEIKDGQGKVVAELLEVPVSSTAKNAFTFRSQVVNPTIFASNTNTNTVYNTAVLFSGSTTLTSAVANVTYNSRILYKELLKRTSTGADAASANGTNIGTAAEGFDHKTKTAIFRISVNSDGLDFTSTAENAINSGAVTVTDTLPAGWEFDQGFYKIFEGTGGANSVMATTDVTQTIGIAPSFESAVNPNGEKVSFTFNTLSKPYVILVKAKLTDGAYAAYLKTNAASKTDTNSVKMTVAAGWSHNISSTHGVTVQTNVLNKTGVVNNTDATLTWTVDYKPFDLTLTGAKIEDTLSEGLELPIEANGDPKWTAITITKLTMAADGTLTPETGAGATVDPSTCFAYNAGTRTLTFTVPDVKQAYRLTYVTDITLEASGSVNNAAKLVGCAADGAHTEQTHQISYQSGWASLQRGGWVEVTKTKGDGSSALSGAEFTLYAADGTTVIRKATSGTNGKLKMRAIPVGTGYTLKETKVPDNYEGDSKVYPVTVAMGTDNQIATSIDGGSNQITVRNYQVGTVGALRITKTVAGNPPASEADKEFTFTVTLPAGSYDYTGSKSGTVENGGKITLKNGESVTIHNLPKDSLYKVEEDDYAGGGYEISSRTLTGTIVADQTQLAAFTNTKNVGILRVSKAVAGNAGDKNELFDFTVKFFGTGRNRAYSYTGENGGPSGTISAGSGEATFTLKHGQSVLFEDLSAGMEYIVEEHDYAGEGYRTTTGTVEETEETEEAEQPENNPEVSGTIVADDPETEDVETTPTAAFLNTKNVGALEVKKTVAGNAGDKNKSFDFTVKFEGWGADRPYTFAGTNGGPSGEVETSDDGTSTATFSLKHGQSVIFTDLSAGMNYTVTEADYTKDGYRTVSTGATGTIEAGENAADVTAVAAFTNTRSVSVLPTTGNLTISKTVAGEGVDRTKKFEFTVTLTGASGAYSYTGASKGTLRSGDKISLAGGESITITDLPDGAGYSVTEADYSKDGYVKASTGESGSIVANGSKTAAFTNTKEPKKLGSLTIGKTVAGNAGEKARKFEFTITLTDAPDAYSYSGAVSGTLRSGDKITLAHGESITITGLPEGAAYSVTEADYTADGYKATSTGASGTIAGNAVQTAAFVNTKDNEQPQQPEQPEQPDGTDETDIDGDVPRGGLDGSDSGDGDELYEFDEDVPRGYLRGSDGKLYKIVGYDANGMPITGDEAVGDHAGLAIVLLSLMLGGLIGVDVMLRRKKRNDRQ